MLIRKTVEDYLFSPFLALAVGLLVGSLGLLAMSTSGGAPLFTILALILMLFGFATASYGFAGIMERKKVQALTKNEEKKVHALSQSLKVRYPTYTLKVHKLKEKHETLHEKFPEVRTYAEEFKGLIETFQAELVALETQLHDNLQKHAPVINNNNVDSVAKKIIWSDKQLELTQLSTALKTLAETENPIVPETYRSVLSRIHKDLKRLDNGVTLYHELLIACTKETATFDAIQALKQEVEEVDTLMALHEAELQKLETSTQTQYEMSKMALSMFEERFRAFKTGCEF